MFPLDQAGWDKLALSSGWLFFLFFSKLPPLETSRYGSALSVVLQPDKGDYAENLLVLSCTNKQRFLNNLWVFISRRWPVHPTVVILTSQPGEQPTVRKTRKMKEEKWSNSH